MIAPFLFAALAAVSMTDVSNITVRAVSTRTANLREGRAISSYEQHMKSLEQHRKMSGGGEQSETEDMERAVPRLKGLAEIEEKARAEKPSVREAAAFVDTFACIVALDDEETRRFVAHLVRPNDDLGKSDKPLFDKISSSAFQAALRGKLSRAGCGYTGNVFTYSSVKKLEKLRRQMERRLQEVCK